MFTLLRKVRKSLISAGSTRKYVLYAIGEIALVVIGILIALQVSAWSEERKERRVERNYLTVLYEEYTFNSEELKRCININNLNVAGAKELLKHTGPGTATLSDSAFSKLLFRTINAESQFRPSSGVLTEMLSSGKLDVLQNSELKTELAAWNNVIEKLRHQESELQRFRYRLIDYTTNELNMRSAVDHAFGNSFGFGSSPFKGDNRMILKDPVFDNLLLGFNVTGQYLNGGYYAPAQATIDHILELISQDLSSSR